MIPTGMLCLIPLISRGNQESKRFSRISWREHREPLSVSMKQLAAGIIMMPNEDSPTNKQTIS